MAAGTRLALGLQVDEDFIDALAERVFQRVASLAGAAPATVEDGWLNSRDAVRYLGLTSLHALHKLTAARQVPFVQDRPGARCWFRRSDLDRWREAHQLGHVGSRR